MAAKRKSPGVVPISGDSWHLPGHYYPSASSAPKIKFTQVQIPDFEGILKSIQAASPKVQSYNVDLSGLDLLQKMMDKPFATPVANRDKQFASDMARSNADSKFGDALGWQTAAASGLPALNARLNGRKVSDLSPDLQQLFAKAAAAEQTAGVKEHRHNSVLNRVIDVLSRGDYAASNAFHAWDVFNADPNKGKTLGSRLGLVGDVAHAAWRGFEGKDKVTFSKAISASPSQDSVTNFLKTHNKTRAATGLGLDIGLDPISYVGTGIVKTPVTAVRAVTGGGKAAKTAQEAARLAEARTLARTLDEHGVVIPGLKDEAPAVRQEVMTARLHRGGIVKGAVGETSHATNQAVIQDMHKFVDKATSTMSASMQAKFLAEEIAKIQAQLLKPVATKNQLTVHLIDDKLKPTDLHRYFGLHAQKAKISSDLAKNPSAEIAAKLHAQHAKIDEHLSQFDAVHISHDHAWIKDAKAHPEVKTQEEEILRLQREGEKVKKQIIARQKAGKPIPKALRDNHAQLRKDWKDARIKRDHLAAEHAYNEVKKVQTAGRHKGKFVSKDIKENLGKAPKNPTDGVISVGGHAGNDTTDAVAQLVQHRAAYAERVSKGEVNSVRGKKRLAELDAEIQDLKNKHVPATSGRTLRVVKQEHNIPGHSATAAKAMEAFNAKLLASAKAKATARAAAETDAFRKNAMDFLAREAKANNVGGLQLALRVPFTKMNNPRDTALAFTLHAPAWLQSGIDKAVNIDVIKRGVNEFDKLFKASAGSDPYLNRLRLAGAGHATTRIAYHANRLRAEWAAITPGSRKLGMQAFRRAGVINDGTDVGKASAAFASALNDLGQMFKEGGIRGFDGKISPSALNNYLPEGSKLNLEAARKASWSVGSADWWKGALSDIKEDTDPAQLIWRMTVGREMVATKKAITANVIDQFGIELGTISPEMKAEFKRLGYKPASVAGTKVLFAPEVADDVNKMFHLMDSQNDLKDILAFSDKLLRPWKKLVTMYNIPGYYLRNSFGDIFVAHLAGVSGAHGLKSYQLSWNLLRRMGKLPNDAPLNKLIGESIDPAAELLSHNGLQGAKTLFLKNGKSVSDQDVWLLYNQMGLRTGLVNTEFKAAFGTPLGTESGVVNSVLDKARVLDQKIGDLASTREDFHRLAHFIDVMRKSKQRNLENAAMEAADSVRKYHFDYGDFTKAEKQVFSRIIPFYKWTRKALPLMIETLFAQPGKALHYPKAMRALSEATGYQFSGNDPVPASDDVIPKWLDDRMAMPVRLPGMGGPNTNFMDPSTPFNDIMKMGGNPSDDKLDPLRSILAMTNPALKDGFEIASGQTAQGVPVNNAQDYLMSQAPQTSLLNSIIKGKDYAPTGAGDALTNPRMLQFLSALGITENTDSRMKAELTRRLMNATSVSKAKAKKAKAQAAANPKPGNTFQPMQQLGDAPVVGN